ncbi:MAG: MATE family efflux transporter [Parasporobacterium sp.]|nr:MATE family efflux transporter [Parasporobacterium sp.]
MKLSTLKEYLGDKVFYKTMLKIAIPVSLQSLITVGVNLMDTVMLSSMGDAQLSASSQAGQFITLFMIMCMGLGMGASVLTSRYFGMKEEHSLKSTITIMFRIALIFAVVFMIVTALIPSQIMSVFSPDREVIDYGAKYLYWMIPTFLCTGITVPATVVLRSCNQVKIPLISSIIAFFINIFCNWVFIFGELGAPRMEIEGAALGTLIARVFELVFIFGYMVIFDKNIGYRIRHLFMKTGGLLSEFLRISVPVIISDTLLVLGTNIIAIIMGHIGTTFVTANSVTAIVQQCSTVFTQGISNASGIITGQTMGQGHYEKAQKQGYTFAFTGLIFGLFAALIILILRQPILDYYQVSAEAKEIAGELMNAILITVIFQSVNSVLTKGVLRAGGDTKFLMVGDVLFLWVAAVPLGALAGLVWHLPSFWIFILLKIDQFIKAIWCMFRLSSGKWLKRIRTEDEIQQKALQDTE